MKAAPIEKTVRVGSLRLDVRKYRDGRFGFDFKPPGENRVKVRTSTLERADTMAKEILGAARGGKVERLAIDEDEYAEFLRWRAERPNRATVPDLVKSFIHAKEGKGRSEDHLRRLRADLKAFADFFPAALDGLDRKRIEAWLNARKVGPRRWNNIRESLVALHRFARREGALGAQLAGAELIERREVVVNVETYTPDELERIIGVVPDEWLPFVVLGAFCGIRPQEVSPEPGRGKPGLLWENILWAKHKIDIPARVSKTRRRRFATLTTAAAAFLLPWKRKSGPVCPIARPPTAAWGIASKVGWKSDALRHSYASYRLAITQNLAALALELGNSPDMIHRHYLDLKHASEARQWFAIRPAKEAKNIVRFA